MFAICSTTAHLSSASSTGLDWVSGSLRRAIAWAEERDYEGFSKYDALSSPILKMLSLNNKYMRLIFSQLVMRFPVNIRGLLLIPKSKNPKGIALFALSYLDLHRLYGEEVFATRARNCLNWLLAHSAEGYSGYCWGYGDDWQTPKYFVPAFQPASVVTAFAGEAFMRAYEVLGDEEFLQIARSAINFLGNDLTVLYSSEDMKCYSYTPFDQWIVLNVNALCAALRARVYRHTGEDRLKEEARQIIYFVVDKQTEYGAWYYAHPPETSHLTHDNYHTGFVLDAILDYTTSTGDQSFIENYKKGLEFYRQELFLENGAPKFLFNRIYPLDIHGAAQGIVTFSKAAKYGSEYTSQALKIAKWAVENMQAPDGHFYYQKGRFFTKKFSLMRWNQAWMVHALSTLLCSLDTTQSND